jgi:hypothetical protein
MGDVSMRATVACQIIGFIAIGYSSVYASATMRQRPSCHEGGSGPEVRGERLPISGGEVGIIGTQL